MDRVKSVASLFVDTYKKWYDDRAIRMAAALAYYGLFSIAPLVFILTAAIGAFVERSIGEAITTNDVMQLLENILGPDLASYVLGLAEGVGEGTPIGEGLPIVTLISVGILLWGASNIFNYMHEVLNRMWGVQPLVNKNWFSGLRRRLLAFAVVLVAGLLLVLYLVVVTLLGFLIPRLSEVLPEALNILPDLRLLQVAQFAVLFIAATLLFGAIYKILPEVDLGWRDVAVGATFTSLLFGVGTFLLGIYFTFYSSTLYGAAGSVIVLLLWFYYTAQIFLYGAEFTYVYATRYGSKAGSVEDESSVRDQDNDDEESTRVAEADLATSESGDEGG
jgi:membrane protein